MRKLAQTQMRLRLGPWSQTPKTNETPKLTRAVSSASSTSSVFHGWKDVDLIVRSVVEEEDDDDLLNEGFCHYSIINDKVHGFGRKRITNAMRDYEAL